VTAGDGTGGGVAGGGVAGGAVAGDGATVNPPYALLAEVTHRCPLHCLYCSNPLELLRREEELVTAEWCRVFAEAAALGVVQVHLSGGEPLLRGDLLALVAEARRLGIYTNLITSGLGLTDERATQLAAAGLNSVQLSAQDRDSEVAEAVAGRRALPQKAAAARAIRHAGLPLSMNVVLHRLNLDHLDGIIEMCASWGAERLELANTQYYGWALRNRSCLLPNREQVQAAEAVYHRWRVELEGRMELLWILPDYYEPFPKPCMGGWAATSLTVAPDGVAYPCPVAAGITTLAFPSVREHPLEWVWHDSPAFSAYRGTDWMPLPCRDCDRRTLDFGGCRCQAFALTGDASRTDPVCSLSPDHHLVEAALVEAERGGDDRSLGPTRVPAPAYRRHPASRPSR